MTETRRVLAVVPARSGSKGLPGKNWRQFRGRSLVELAVESALGCPLVTDVVISSDDERAAVIAADHGVTFQRRRHAAASDTATAADVMHDVLSSWADHTEKTLVVYLQPTSPLRTSTHVSEALALLLEGDAQACVSVTQSPVSAQKLVTLGNDGLLQTLFGDQSATANRAELPNTLLPNGAIYIFPAHMFLHDGVIPISGAVPYFMDPGVSLDIDSESDWDRLESTVIAHD